MENAIFQRTFDYIDGRLAEFLGARLASVIGVVDGPLAVGITLYIVLYGYAVFRGSIQEPIMDFAMRAIKLVLIYQLATTVAYNEFVTQPLFFGFPNTIAAAVSGGGVSGIGQAFDQFFGSGAQLAIDLFEQGSAFNIDAYLVGVLVLLATLIGAGIGFGITVLAKVALALLVALGPIFVACCLFEATRRFFFGWLAQAVNYIILFGLIITVFTLVLDLVQSEFGAFATAPSQTGAGIFFSAISLLAAIFFLQVPAIAAGIAGGASAGLADFANAARHGAKGAANGTVATAKGGAIAGRAVYRAYTARRGRGGSVSPGTPDQAPRRPGAGSA